MLDLRCGNDDGTKKMYFHFFSNLPNVKEFEWLLLKLYNRYLLVRLKKYLSLFVMIIKQIKFK